MNRRSLSLIAIGLIAIIVLSSVIAYELGFMRPSEPSGSSPRVLWQRPIENFANSLAVDDGKVFTTDNSGNVNCFDSQNGESIWNGSARKGFLSSGLAISGGKVYVGFKERSVGCLEENTGQPLWTFQNEQAPNRLFKGPAGIIVKDGRLFAITDTISAHNSTTGALLWQAIYALNGIGTIMQPNNTWTGGSVTGYPLDGDPFDGNYVYATAGNTSSMYFFKLNTDNGTVLWHSNVTWNNAIPEVKIFPQVLAISQQQVIIEIRKNNGILWPNLISLDSNTGKELWDITVGASIYNPIFHNNLLLFGASDGNFYALNLTDGTISWKTKVDTQNLFSFANSAAQTFPIQIDSQNQRLFWSFAAKQPSTGNYTGTLCSLDLTNGNMTWTKQIADMGNFAGEVGSAYNDNRVFLTYNSALWIFNASTGDLVQSQQFDHYVLPPIVLGNETFVAADLWLFAYS